LAVVRQAHLPGNFELYDPEENRLGPPVCKICWERFGKENSASLNTVWVSFESRSMVWWLCGGHMSGLKNGEDASVRFQRSSPGAIVSPGL